MNSYLSKDQFLNKIVNGDCVEQMAKYPDSCVDMVLTDIPYGEVNDASQHKNSIRKVQKNDADTLTFDLETFLEQIMRLCRGSFYLFCGMGQISTIRHFFDKVGLTTRLGVWKKTNPSPMNGQHLWLSGMEYCVYAKKSCATFNEHCKTPLWEYPSGSGKRHPTEKPIDLFRYLINVSSVEGDTVLDPCLGSGTTAMACAMLGRDYIGIEKNPEYVEIAQERLAEYSRQVYDQWDDRYIPLESEDELPDEIKLGDFFASQED